MASAEDILGDDISKWNILYPNYLNSCKTEPEGRRIAKAKAVEHPQAVEMAEICQFLKIPHKLEMDKAYPRDWLVRGRVRVLLKTPGGAFTHEEIHSKKALMIKMGELIPKLKSRAGGGATAAAVAAGQVPGGQAAASSGGAATNKSQKKEAKREEKKANKKAGKR